MKNTNKHNIKDNSIRVLHLAPLGAGGISNLVVQWSEKMLKDEVIFDYLVFRNQKEFFEDRVLKNGGKKIIVDISKYDLGLRRGISKLFNSYKVLRKSKIDIFHINASTPYDVLLAIVAKLAGVKSVVFHSHNAKFETNSMIKKMLIKFCRPLIPLFSDKLLSCSDKAAEFMYGKRITNNKKYSLIRNGIEVSRYTFNSDIRKKERERLNICDKIVIGHIGRFSYQKNHEKVLSVFKEIKSRNENACLLLIGEGELYENIQNLAFELGISDSIIFYGTSNNVNDMMNLFDLFLLPSRFEGLPVVAVEAQANDLPVVMSSEITKEVSISKKVCFVDLDEDDGKWADICLDMVDEHDNRRDNRNLLVDSGYDINVSVDKLKEIYMDLYNH